MGGRRQDVVAEDELGGVLSYEDADRRREPVRTRIAMILLGLLAADIAAIFLAMFAKRISVENGKDLIAVTVPPLLALVGTVIGFYYGERSASRRTEETHRQADDGS